MTPLQTAQKAFTDWLRNIDSDLATAEHAFDEFSGGILLNDPAAAGRILAEAERSVKLVRAKIAVGLLFEQNTKAEERDER
jgi:hypothetical protein